MNKLWIKDGNTAIFMFLNLKINPRASRLHMHNFFECFAKFWIENCVNHWIYNAVYVAQPSGQYESCYSWITVVVHFRTYCVGNVTTEKWQPTNQKYTCKTK